MSCTPVHDLTDRELVCQRSVPVTAHSTPLFVDDPDALNNDDSTCYSLAMTVVVVWLLA